MKLIVTTETDPYRNLAVEESLFTSESDDLIFLWRNAPSVIIGRNQNALAETDQEYTHSTGISITRRLTGGGAVYHDEGNINVSYIFTCTDEDGTDMFNEKCGSFLSDFIAYLRSIGIKAELNGRNDVVIRDQENMLRKIAGMAMSQKKDRGLIHLCLLFDVDMEKMEKALTPSVAKLQSKGVASVRSRTINIRDAYPQFADCSADAFFDGLRCHYQVFAEPVHLSEHLESQIDDLYRNRYKNDDWIFGRSPGGQKDLL